MIFQINTRDKMSKNKLDNGIIGPIENNETIRHIEINPKA